jgi:hypothetical protein
MLDPCNDRVAKDVPRPPRNRLSLMALCGVDNGKPNSKLMRQHLILEGKLEKTCLMHLIIKASQLFSKTFFLIPYRTFIEKTSTI